jgi:hypothetical protein
MMTSGQENVSRSSGLSGNHYTTVICTITVIPYSTIILSLEVWQVSQSVLYWYKCVQFGGSVTTEMFEALV